MRRPYLIILKIGKIITLFFLFILLNIIIKLFIVDVFRISGYSMYPTLKDGDRVVILKSYYGIRKPKSIYEIPWLGIFANYVAYKGYTNSILKETKTKIWEKSIKLFPIKRGDIIAFNIPQYPSKYAIKRCVGLPRDSIKEYVKVKESPWLTPFDVVPYKGMKIKESELTQSEHKFIMQNNTFKYNSIDSCYIATMDCFLVLGDNINGSEDSRVWGCIPENNIIGKFAFKF